MARNKYDVDESLESPFNIRHLKRAGKYIKRHASKMITAFILHIISIVAGLFAPVIVKITTDEVVTPAFNGLIDKDVAIKQLFGWSALLLLCIVVSVLFVSIRYRIITKVAQGIIYDIRTDIFSHLQRLSFSYYDDRPHGKILVRVVNYVNNVADILSGGLLNFILEFCNLAFIMIFMFFIDARLAWIILAGVPVLLTIVCIIQPIQRRNWQKFSNKNSNMNAYIHESINGVKITQIFTREEKNQEIFNDLVGQTKSTWMRTQYFAHLIWMSVQNIAETVAACVYICGVLYTGASYGTILAMGDYTWRFWQPITRIANLYNQFINGIAYLERIFETMDEPVGIDDAPDAYELPQIVGEVEFRDVVFEYEEGHPILENISFKVKPGESIALVGPTGAGKTTIVNLISRFYDIKSGQVLIDGHDVSKVTLHSLRSQMGIMLQDSFIFSGNLLENIQYGKLDATLDEVREAAKTVNADGFIEEMYLKYYTEVNERGSRLSQGQKQLISFARTLVSDPKILILDEATSSIDTKTERLVQDGLLKMLKGRTSFIIAHRLSTIKNCDKIMYIANRQIMECGTHDELMAKKGEYYKLYTSQLDTTGEEVCAEA